MDVVAVSSSGAESVRRRQLADGSAPLFRLAVPESQVVAAITPERPTQHARRSVKLRRVHPFLDAPPPLAIAHRGAAGDAPENTMEAFAIAVDLGCRYLETDAHVTRDGVVVAFHDCRLDRVTDRRGRIRDLSIAEVEQADAGVLFPGYRGRGVRVPRLEDLLTRWPDARVNIDPKEDSCVEPLVALLDRLDAWHRVCIGAFSDARIKRVRRLARGRACTSMGPAAVATAWLSARRGRMPRLGANCVQVPRAQGRFRLVTERFVDAAHDAGLPVHVWTVDDPVAMQELLALGVDGIMTNRPRVLLEILGDGTMGRRAGAESRAVPPFPP